MALGVQVGSFTKSGTSNTITTTFKVKALIMWGTGFNGAADTYIGTGGWQYGLSDGTNNFCAANTVVDGAATSDTYANWSGTPAFCACTFSAATTVLDKGAATFGASTDFTITWTNSGTPQTPVFYYLALGGDDITNSLLDFWDIGTTATGNISNDVYGFQGHLGISIHPGIKTGASANAAHANSGISAFASTSRRWAIATLDEDASTTQDSWAYARKDRCIVRLTNAGAIDSQADFVSWNAGGFTWNHDDAPAASTYDNATLVIQGADLKIDVGSFAKPTSTGAQTQNVTLNDATLTPDVVLISSINQPDITTNTPANKFNFSLGAATATDEGCLVAGAGPDASDPMINAETHLNNKVVRLIQANATHTSSTTDAEASIVTGGSLSTAGQFTLNWTTNANTTATRLFYIAIQGVSSLERVTQTSIIKYNILGRIVASRILKYNIIGRTVQSTILKYHIRLRILKSTILKYNLIGRVSSSVIFKYNLIGRITQAVALKYNIVARATRNAILKYNIVGRAVQNIILKYNLIGRITQQAILKYNLIGRTVKSAILKYNIAERITQSTILKYNIQVLEELERITQSVILKYNLIGRITQTSILKYNIIGRISQSLVLKYNLIGRIIQSTILKYNLIGRAVQSTILKYNIAVRVVQSSILKYNILGRVAQSTILKYNLVGRTVASTIIKYNILTLEELERVTQNVILKYNLIGRITQSTVLKYDIIERISQSLILKYNLIGRTIQSTILKYNILSRTVQNTILKYNLLQTVSKSLILKYNILQMVFQNLIVKYHTVARIASSIVLKYNLAERITNTLITKYNIAVQVANSIILKYSILERVASSVIFKYGILSRVVGNVILHSRILSLFTRITRQLIIKYRNTAAQYTFIKQKRLTSAFGHLPRRTMRPIWRH